jgi:hypothetical protein
MERGKCHRARGSKVAVIDTGIISTPALIHALAKNSEEELNGLDDDGTD